MAVEKFSISLPSDLVADLDELADKRGLTRSGMVREAAAEYVAVRKSKQYEEERKRRMEHALAEMDRIAAESPPGGKSSLEILREIREESMGGPWKYPDDE